MAQHTGQYVFAHLGAPLKDALSDHPASDFTTEEWGKPTVLVKELAP
jgi:hypothetical protein